jgi:hypothetical protein
LPNGVIDDRDGLGDGAQAWIGEFEDGQFRHLRFVKHFQCDSKNGC